MITLRLRRPRPPVEPAAPDPLFLLAVAKASPSVCGCAAQLRAEAARLRAEWNAVSGGWRITCVLPAPGDDREANHA